MPDSTSPRRDPAVLAQARADAAQALAQADAALAEAHAEAEADARAQAHAAALPRVVTLTQAAARERAQTLDSWAVMAETLARESAAFIAAGQAWAKLHCEAAALADGAGLDAAAVEAAGGVAAELRPRFGGSLGLADLERGPFTPFVAQAIMQAGRR